MLYVKGFAGYSLFFKPYFVPISLQGEIGF